jgi:hypothetical protein
MRSGRGVQHNFLTSSQSAYLSPVEDDAVGTDHVDVSRPSLDLDRRHISQLRMMALPNITI